MRWRLESLGRSAHRHPPLIVVVVQDLRVASRTPRPPRPSSSPRSSWRKCPPPAIVVCGLPCRAGDLRLQARASRARGDRVGVAERGQERLRPTARAPPTRAGWARPRGRRGCSAPASGTGARRPCTTRRGTARRRPRSPRAARSVVQPPFTIRPTGNCSDVLGELLPGEERLAGSRSPVGRNVLAATTRAKRSGCSATRRRPMSPPQSWHDERDAARGRASSIRRARIQSTWRWYV